MTRDSLRIDKWLWFARFFKSRAEAARLVTSGQLRLNAVAVTKAKTAVRPGDVLTFPKADHVRVVEITALGGRRGPASEAAGLYRDLDPPTAANRVPAAMATATALNESRAKRPSRAGRTGAEG